MDIEDQIEIDNDDTPFAEIPAGQMAEAESRWPAEVASRIKELYTGLCVVRKRFQLKLPVVVTTLQSLLQDGRQNNEPFDATDATTAHVVTAATAPAAAAVPTEPSPLSLQVRGMRHADGPELSVQRNVSEAFDSCVRRLDDLYKSAAADAPVDFHERIDYWRRACGMPHEVHRRMHTLRIWRNASLHHNEERWSSEGPRSAAEATQYVAELDKRIRQLESSR